jgi:hypothetical protein
MLAVRHRRSHDYVLFSVQKLWGYTQTLKPIAVRQAKELNFDAIQFQTFLETVELMDM